MAKKRVTKKKVAEKKVAKSNEAPAKKRVSKKTSKRRRLSRDETKSKMTNQNSQGNWFNLPNGAEVWAPDKKARYSLDIVPYEVTTNMHPEEIEAGNLWFRTQFRIHHGVGANEQSIVCPRSIGQKCIICDEADRLAKEDYDANEDVIRSLRGQRYTAMNILHPENKEQIAVLVLSSGKFDNVLKEELQEEENHEHLDFYHCEDGGRTLRIRFSERKFAGSTYLQATDMQFKERDDMDEDKILDMTVDLDNMLNVLPPEKIQAMFDEGEEEKDSEEEEEVKPRARKKGTKKKAAKKASKEEPEKLEIPEGSIECKACSENDEPGKNSKGGTCKPCKGKGYIPDPDLEEEEEEDDSWIDNGMDEEEDEDNEDWDDEDEDDEEEEDDDEDEDDEDWDDEDDEEDDEDDEDWDDEDEE